ncbi:AsmA protein [Rhizobium sp. NFR07]|nr:AsmA protein [Rhizobium sp. NFR07]
MRLSMLKTAVDTLRRHANRPFGRVLLVSMAVLIVLGIVFRIAAPFMISTLVVRESMENSVSQWTGHNATIGEVSRIRFWPHPEVTLTDVTIHRDTGKGEKTLAKIAELSATFDLGKALLGRPVFENFHLTNAHVTLTRTRTGGLEWTNGGLLMEAIAHVGQANGGQRLDADRDAPIGEMQVTNGTIEIVNETDGHSMQFDAINGTMDWPELSGAVDINAETIFRGRKIALDVSTSQPLLLLGGRGGQFRGLASTDIGLASFNGMASFSLRGYFSGDAELRTSDMPAALRWLDIDPALADGLFSASATAKIIADRDDLRFENLSLGLNDEHATGLLEVDTPTQGQPRLSGTLAFDHIDFLRLLKSMEPAIGDDDDGRIPPLVKRLELDLRLSARTAALGAVQLQDVALGLMNVGQQFRLDILDGNMQPGRLTGRVNTIREDERDAVAIRLSLRGADFAAIARQFNMTGPVPATQGTFDLSLDLPRPLNRDAWNAAVGTMQFNSGAGRLDGLNLSTIRQLAGQKSYFALGEASNGSLEFESIKASAVVHDGIADIREAQITGTNDVVTMTGAVPLVNRSFALSATVAPKAGTDKPLHFFIGGAWPSPVFWPTAAPGQKPGE